MMDLRGAALTIFQSALDAVDPVRAVRHAVSLDDDLMKIGEDNFSLDGFNRILVIGAGKASASMALALRRYLAAGYLAVWLW